MLKLKESRKFKEIQILFDFPHYVKDLIALPSDIPASYVCLLKYSHREVNKNCTPKN